MNPFDNSIMKRDSLKAYQQHGAQLNQSNQNNESIFGENYTYHQIGNDFLEFYITVRKSDSTIFHYDDPIRLVRKGFAFCFKEAHSSFTIRSDMEHNNFCGQVSTFMKVTSNKDGDLLPQFDKINGNDNPTPERLIDLLPQMIKSPHQKMLTNNHTDPNKGTIKRIFIFRRHFWILQKFKRGN